MLNSKTLLLASAAVLALSTTAFAQDGEGNWYGSAALGANWLEETNGSFPGFPTTFESEFDSGWVMTGAIGYRWDSLRLEFELANRDNDSEDVTYNVPIVDTSYTDVSYFSQMVNLIWDIPVGEHARFSIGAGIGGAFVNYDMGGIAGATLANIDDDEYVFAYQGIAGLSFDISDRMELFAEYRYFATDEFDVSGVTPGGFPMAVTGDPVSHSGLIGVRYHFIDVEPPLPPEQPVVDQPPPPKTYIVFFDFNKSNLTAEAQTVVAEAAEAFKSTGSARVLVVGHTDTVGSASYNQALSERRADNVAAELTRLGVPGDSISTEGRGFSDPMVPTGPGVREPQNRRAVIELQ